MQRAAVESELQEYREFIDRWLDASEEARPKKVSSEEQRFRDSLGRVVRGLRSVFHDAEALRSITRAVGPAIAQRNFPTLVAVQIESSIQDVVSTI
jgi:hypothetical protein